MNGLIIIGIVLGGGTKAVERFFCRLPNWLAIVLYAAAVILIVAGMLRSRMPTG